MADETLARELAEARILQLEEHMRDMVAHARLIRDGLRANPLLGMTRPVAVAVLDFIVADTERVLGVRAW